MSDLAGQMSDLIGQMTGGVILMAPLNLRLAEGFETGDPQSVAAAQQALDDRLKQTRQPYQLANAAATAQRQAELEGRFDDARRLMEDAERIRSGVRDEGLVASPLFVHRVRLQMGRIDGIDTDQF